MKSSWIVVVLALIGVCAPVSAQDAMKMGDKSWNELEKRLNDMNQQWLCVGKYNKPTRQ